MLSEVSLQRTFDTISGGHFWNSNAKLVFVIYEDSQLMCLKEGWHWKKREEGGIDLHVIDCAEAADKTAFLGQDSGTRRL